MPCEKLEEELDNLRSDLADKQADYNLLVGSAKAQSPLRNEIIQLNNKIFMKDKELIQCLTANGIIFKTVRTKFRPETDGFSFTNHWTWDATEKQTLRQVISDALGLLEALLSPILYVTLAPGFVGIPFPFNIWALEAAISAANTKIVDAITHAIETDNNGVYGLCGGMAFASLDYWHRHWIVPQGTGPDDQPQRNTPQGAVLRDYIWTRLLKSVQNNASTFLQWMGMANTTDGDKWLLNQTIEHLTTLRYSLASGIPMPIGLVGTTANPFHNHQVVCYGLKDETDGTTSLFIYDNNHPQSESVIQLDVRGSRLETVRDDTSQPHRGPLRGIFCEVYVPAEPPKAVVLRQRLSVAPVSAGVRRPLDVHYTAANVSYATSSPISLVVSSDGGAFVGEVTPTSITTSGERQMNLQMTFAGSGDHKLTVAAELGNFGGIDILKLLPSETAGLTDTVTVSIFNAQNNWRWCSKCQGLFFAGNGTMGFCPVGGEHVPISGGNSYNMTHNSPAAPGQPDWRWCNKCQVMFFGGGVSTSRCPAPVKGKHDLTGSGDYTIEQNIPSGGQNNWRWCNKCQGLHFAGSPTEGACPAGGMHIHAGSGDYHLFQG